MHNRALILLLWLTVRAKLRRSLRGARTLRGAAFLALGLMVLGLWLGPAIAVSQAQNGVDLNRTRDFFPLLLLVMCVSNLVTTAGERAVAFSPAEVDLLFAAPFTRRQLLIYKIARSSLAAISGALLFSILFLRHASLWLSAFVGILLSLLLLQLLSLCIVLLGQTVGKRAYTRGRQVAMLVIVIVLALAVTPALRSGEPTISGAAQTLRETAAARALLAPFDVFARVVTSETVYPELLQWSASALLILGFLFIVVIWLDAQYLELSAAAGQRLHERVQRMRSAGGLALRAQAGSMHLRIPMLPRFGGAGAVAWRQLTAALRQSKSLLILLLLISLGAGPALYFGGMDIRAGGAIIGLCVWLTAMLGNTLRFDFRGDVDHIDVLKSFPIHPWTLSFAQLIAPTLVMSVLQIALLAGMRLILRVDAIYLIAAAMLAVPFNLLLFATENLIFLLFPGRYAAGPGDLQGFGRQMVVLFLKMLIITVLAAIAGIAGAVSWRFTHAPLTAFAIAAVILTLEFLALMPALVWAYLKFDPSRDVPD